MKRNTPYVIALLFICVSLFSAAQDAKEGKIIVEITKEINGEKRTFKGEYENAEQMRADPNYQEFAGEDDRIGFWFNKDGDDDAFLKLHQFDQFGKSFGFGFGGQGLQQFDIFKHLDEDSAEASGFFHFDSEDWEENEESIRRLQEEMETLMERIGEERGNRIFMLRKHIKITDVEGDEFGKKGDVSDNHLLELEDLSFFPNPSSDGRFKVRFTVPSEDELTIKVFNIEGKEVFHRYFERFGGRYSESIDLSGQKEGIYLLEISQDNKRLTKKIIIN